MTVRGRGEEGGRRVEGEGGREGGRGGYLKLALAENDENGVHQLGNLAENEEHDPEATGSFAVGLGSGSAHGLSEAQRRDVVQQVWHGAEHAAKGEEGEAQVPVRQRSTPVETLSEAGKGRREGERKGKDGGREGEGEE